MYECCHILKIKEPKIKWQPQDKFPTETLVSAVTGSKDDLTILLSNQFLYNDMTDANLAFFIMILAHELRHCYQIEHDLIKDYDITLANSNDKNDYNNQEVELDAYGFAFAYLRKEYHVEPILPLSEETIENIRKHRDIIEKELF
jgi:hypothetical protein